MDNFVFHMYTDIVFGRNAEEQAGQKIREHGGSKVMLVYGGGSIKRSGLYDKVVTSLKRENLPFVELSGIQPNPLLSVAHLGLELARKESVDFLLAVGGGSSIDTAKGIALGLVYEGDLWDFYTGAAAPKKMAPVGTIPTIAAAGSETSRSTVLVHDKGRIKRGIMYPPCRPVFSLLNPEWTYTLPSYQTAAGAADIFAHVVERYFYPGESYLKDKFSEGLMRSVVKYTPVALGKPDHYEARAEIMLAAAMAHNDLAGLGLGGPAFDRGCHGLEAQISGAFDTTHGAGLSVIMPAWMEYTSKMGDNSQHIKFAVNVFGVEPDPANPQAVIAEGIRRFKTWLKQIGMPLKLSEMGIKAGDIKTVLENGAPPSGGTIGSLVKLTAKDMENIYLSAL